MDNEQAAELTLIKAEIELESAEAKIRSLTVKRWLRTGELALYLGTSRDAVKKLVQRKRIEYRKLFGRLYFDRVYIDSLIEDSGGASKVLNRRNRWR